MASWYGMNFHNMPELAGQYSYYILITLTIVVCVILYFVLKRARWL